MKKVLVTGAAGFIGFHLSLRLLKRGYEVVGLDSLDPYYDPRLKRRRLALLRAYPRFVFYKASVADFAALQRVFKKEKPTEVVHLAAQAGVRYSLQNPWAYATANYLGALNVFEAACRAGLKRVLYASSSSVYGANEKSPFSESDRTDRPISVYAASKKANEVLAYAYHRRFGVEMVGLRFFTVYGTWGRPDMALFKFVRLMVLGKTITLYNRGKMRRSFTHVDDVVSGIERNLAQKPRGRYMLYNLGGAKPVPLLRFVALLEQHLGLVAKKRLGPLQPGDVPDTVADTRLARRDLNYKAKVSIEEGTREFVDWFLKNKKFLLSLKEAKQ